MSDPTKEELRFKYLAATVDAIGCLMGTYDPDSPAQEELGHYRRAILGVVTGQKAGIELASETDKLLRASIKAVTEGRLQRAANKNEMYAKAADRLDERELLHKLLDG